MKTWVALVGVLHVAAAPCAAAADWPAPSSAQLAGRTLSAVAYTPNPSAAGGGLRRIMLQAYLAADGTTVLRQWIGSRNSYSAPVQSHWSLSERRLCIELIAGPLCAEVHIWGPRIAGVGTRPYAMLDGDLRPGNAINGAR